RLPTQEDLDIRRENDQLAREAHAWCRKCIETRNLDMKLVDVEVLHDRTKIVFYFTAPGRVDFRELVKDLVKAYHTRIELRQIGVRHETQMLGAIGNCGQICCCRRFMRKFAPVTIKMAKEQNLFLNPTKISGICGRLLCCLSFEQENYEQFQRKCPRVGKKFATAFGMAKILRTNLFRETITILDEAGDERELTVEEWTQAIEARPAVVEGAGDAPAGARSEAPRPAAPRAESPRPEAPRPESGRPEAPRGESRGESRRGEGQSGERRGGGRDHGRDAERRRNAPSAPSAPSAAPAAAPDAAPPAPGSPQPGEGREAPGRSSRRGRRSGRRPSRPGGEAAGEQQQNQRSRSKRPDARQGGKPSREPESGS
ncbi:MAG: regulatory iron-sulfur-containing complex subunit RicT, partial [Acidobacteriota bacterium]